MENNDVFLGLHDFLERMRQPYAAEFVIAIKSFIVSFSNNAPDPDRDSVAVQEFLANMEAAFRAHPLWAGCTREDLESAGEGLEKYVMTKLFIRVFASLPDDLAQKELQKINMYKAPRDKLVCIVNCCKVITNLLVNASVASNENPPGADEFLPVLIYVTIKANPPQLHSNLLYIQRFRRESRLIGEAAYFFTNILSAESFISNIDAKALSLDETEFERNMESARAVLSGLAADLQDHSTLPNQSSGHISRAEPIRRKNNVSNDVKDPSLGPTSSEARSDSKKVTSADELLISKVPSLSDLENKGATMILKEDQVNEVSKEYPYLFAHVGELTVIDVEDLLNNYKQLVFKYVCLSKGLAVAPEPCPPSKLQNSVQQHAETTIEASDSGPVELDDKSQNSTHWTEDSSGTISVTEKKNFESNLRQDEALTPQSGDKMEASN